MNASPIIATLFKYKAWANDEILTAMKLLDKKAHPDERHTAIRILNHTYVVDRIFAAHLRGSSTDTRQPILLTLRRWNSWSQRSKKAINGIWSMYQSWSQAR